MDGLDGLLPVCLAALVRRLPLQSGVSRAASVIVCQLAASRVSTAAEAYGLCVVLTEQGWHRRGLPTETPHSFASA